MIVFLVILSICTTISDTFHFNGGTITWKPIDPTDNSSSTIITITQSYSWMYPDVNCTEDVPITTYSRRLDNENLTCVANCLTQGGYSNNPVNILTDCISSSISLRTMTSQRSINVSLDIGAYFSIAFQAPGWRPLENSMGSPPDWSIVCGIDLRRRPDGIINTPPQSNVASPQYVIVNTTKEIQIHVSDINQSDDVRCRWSQKNNSLGTDECADVCYPDLMPNTTSLSNCVLSFFGPTPNVWYAIALQIEDFINTTSTVPMSSIPIQFLIYVSPIPKCTKPPLLLPIVDCLEVNINVPINLTLYAFNSCNNTKIIIGDISSTINTAGVQMSDVINSTTNTSLVYVIITWTPQIKHIGLQYFCTIAYTNERVQSDQYCMTFYINVSNPNCLSTTISNIIITSEPDTSAISLLTTEATTMNISITSTIANRRRQRKYTDQTFQFQFKRTNRPFLHNKFIEMDNKTDSFRSLTKTEIDTDHRSTLSNTPESYEETNPTINTDLVKKSAKSVGKETLPIKTRITKLSRSKTHVSPYVESNDTIKSFHSQNIIDDKWNTTASVIYYTDTDKIEPVNRIDHRNRSNRRSSSVGSVTVKKVKRTASQTKSTNSFVFHRIKQK
ncbi:unnamed protein product [Adineta ricciae]|uniref:Uncharacterized protein n=1 Tax=Adineta ricciae TaxID=249248 RepID=A0A815QBU3_ADIRI|nr:unnamed protein product [Adineta ricciae]